MRNASLGAGNTRETQIVNETGGPHYYMHHLLIQVAFLIAPALLVLWNRRGWFHHSPWPAAFVVLLYGSFFLYIARANIASPYIWDFGCFWLFGHIAAANLNIYNPAVFHAWPTIETAFRSDANFAPQVLDVSFPYPPPSIFLFLPLGYFHNITAGMIFWYSIQSAALIGAAIVLQRCLFPKESGAAVLIGALTLCLPALTIEMQDLGA